MKRCLLLLLTALLLAGCARQTGHEPPLMAFYNEIEVILDTPAEGTLPLLGVPLGRAETAGTVRTGVEKTYRFPGICIRTYPGEGGERILGFWFTDSTYVTEEGLRLGDSAETVRALLGAFEGDLITVTRGGGTMTVELEKGTVIAIRCCLD